LGWCSKNEESIIQAAIEKAKQQGDNELAQKISELKEKTEEFRHNKVYLPPPEKGKLIE